MSKEWTSSFHKGPAQTYVEVDGKIFKLVPHEKYSSVKDIIKHWPNDEPMPKVRHLNLIEDRTAEAQAARDSDGKLIRSLAKSQMGGDPKKVTSLRKAAALGADVPAEIEKLLKAKKEATDPGEARKIRQQLRKLNYKRYLGQKEEE